MTHPRLSFAIRVARNVALALTAGVAAVLFGAACAKETAVGPGGECFLATDCAPGLVCVEQAKGGRTCTDDLSRVAGKPPPEAGAADASAEAGEGGADGAAPGDGGPPPPPQDSGTPQDSGNPPPPQDSGTPPQDAASE